MRISLPITQVLQASSLGLEHIHKRDVQHPLRPLPSKSDVRPQEHHLSPVIGGAGNYMHTTTISLGTPPQPFSALLDLSSSSLIIPSVQHWKTPITTPTPEPRYNSTSSSTFRPNGTAVKSHFLGSDVPGYLSSDNLHISALTLPNLLFQEAPTLEPLSASPLRDRPVDTLLPLGPYNASAPRNFLSPIAHLIASEILDENVFSLRLSRNPGDGEGQLVLGGVVDEAFYTGEFTTVPMTPLPIPDAPGLAPYYAEGEKWKTSISNLTVGAEGISYAFPEPTVAIFDVSSPFIALPASLVEDLNALLEAGTWGPFAWVDCEKREGYPDVRLVLAGEEFVLTPYDYLLEQQFEDEDDGDRLFCQSAFLPMFEGEESGVVVLGSAFVKAWVSVWDLESGDVSFARAKHGPPRHDPGQDE